jgi:hypothetical protein
LSFQRVLAFWSLLLLYVPLVAGRLRGLRLRSTGPVDTSFYAAFILLAWLNPRAERGPSFLPTSAGSAVMATLAFSAGIALLYVALVPQARRITYRLLGVLVVIDAVAFATIHLSVVRGLTIQRFFLLLPAVTGSVGWVVAWSASRIRPRIDTTQ